jgi:hypothetical protein
MTITVNVSDPLANIAAFAVSFPRTAAVQAAKAMEQVQQDALGIVHRVTGNLAATGRVESGNSGTMEIEIQVIFGGETGIDRFVEYAGYEEDLHPYLAPAVEMHIGDMERALGEAFEDAAP